MAWRAWRPLCLQPAACVLVIGLWASSWQGSFLGASPRAPPIPDSAPACGQVHREERLHHMQATGRLCWGFPVWATRKCCLGISCSPTQGKGSVLFPAFSKKKRGGVFTVVPREAAPSPRPSSKVNSRGTEDVSRGSSGLWRGATPTNPGAHPSSPRLALRIGEGTWLRMRLCASGRLSTRDRWRRVEQRRASHSPRGFPALWRALRAHAAGPSLCRGPPSLCRPCGLPSRPGRAPGPWPAQPHVSGHRHLADPSTSALWGDTALVSPSGSSCVLDDTLHLREMRPETVQPSAPHGCAS